MTPLELSVVMPCRNEAKTVAACAAEARRALDAAGIAGEVIVADNGSTDASRTEAERAGARVVAVPDPGYGSALMGGIAASRGRYVFMADADGSYDFREIPKFVERLRGGSELVQGCRLASGGGTVRPGAMPFLHRWIGNPLFSRLARLWYRAPIHDIHCGLRAFSRELYDRLDLRCTGMEFASEMILKASLRGARISELPITLSPDGRDGRQPHLRTFRDGWRHLRFFLLYSPRWLFLVPGALLVLLGLAGYAIAMPGLRIGGVQFDVHTLLFSSLFLAAGYQSILFAALTRIFAVTQGLLPEDARLTRAFERVNLERGLLAGAAATAAGAVLLLAAVNAWRLRNFGALDYERTMRLAIPGMTLTLLGLQTILSSFFFSILGLKRR